MNKYVGKVVEYVCIPLGVIVASAGFGYMFDLDVRRNFNRGDYQKYSEILTQVIPGRVANLREIIDGNKSCEEIKIPLKELAALSRDYRDCDPRNDISKTVQPLIDLMDKWPCSGTEESREQLSEGLDEVIERSEKYQIKRFFYYKYPYTILLTKFATAIYIPLFIFALLRERKKFSF